MTEEEIDSLEVGSVILYGKNKTPRIVRETNDNIPRSPMNWSVRSVTVAIRRCSWTGRCGTIIDRVKLRECEYTGIIVDLDSSEDEIFEIASNTFDWLEATKLFSCCDAKRELPA